MNRGRLKKIVLVAIVIYIIWKFLSGLIGGLDRDTDKFLKDRGWIERMPKSERDMVHAIALMEVRGRHFGAAGFGSAFRQSFDIVEWKLEKNDLTLVFKQDQVTKKYSVRTWQCAGEAPTPFDLCLELRGGGKTHRFYSREDWVRDSEDAPINVVDVTRMIERGGDKDAECKDCNAETTRWVETLEAR